MSSSSSTTTTSNSSASYINTSTIIAILATSALVYSHWSSRPEWMRGSSSTSSKESGERGATDKDANDDFANPLAIVTKLKEMMTLVSQVSDDVTPDDITDWQMMAAAYSVIHLNTELRGVDPDYRDKQYDDDNRQHDDVQLEELQELKTVLEYAHWAYEMSHSVISANCREAGLDLLRHDTATEPGRVGHFIALDHKNKTAIVGLKGTSSLADVLTDLVALPKEHLGCHFDDKTFAAPSASASSGGGVTSEKAVKSMYCHEGIFTAAIWMADNLQEFIENMLLPLKYKLLICGHSLGAGTACLLGLELRSRISAFRKNYTDLRVLAYATPPVVSFEASKACAPFITSVVNNSDVVPRSSLSNLVVMNKLLLKVNEKLQEKGHTLDTWTSLRNYYNEEVAKVDDDLLLTPDELEEFFQETHAEPEQEQDHLYVPGRCVVMWDKGDNDNSEVGGIVTDCGMKMLRMIELSTTLITDHFIVGYRENMTKLIEQLENTI